MCLIIDKPKGILFPEEDILSAVAVNDEGFGFMWAEDGQVRFEKGDNYTPEDIVAVVKEMEDTHALFHMRYNTAGVTNQVNCHPFKVLDKRVHGSDLFLMHNGTINKCRPGTTANAKRKAMSDSRIFAEEVLRPLLAQYGPSALDNLVLKGLLEDYIGAGNKVVLLDGDGNVTKLNEAQGNKKHGCWVSNVYSFNRAHRTPATNIYGYNRYTQGGNTGPNGAWETNWAREQREASEKAAALKDTSPTNGKAVVTLVQPPKKEETLKLPSKEALEDAPKDILPEFSELEYFLSNPMYVTEDDIENFVYDNPDEAVELIYELLRR